MQHEINDVTSIRIILIELILAISISVDINEMNN